MITGKAGSSEGVSLFSFKINDNPLGDDQGIEIKSQPLDIGYNGISKEVEILL